jgi:DNA-binding winged helix-turn-helix (wHTH) protein
METIKPLKQDWPATFQTEMVRSIMGCVAAGDSCAIVGIGSVGKSNLLRFLLRDDVRQAYLGDEHAAYLFVYLDGNKLLKPKLWGLVELVLHQLSLALAQRGVEPGVLQVIENLHQKAAKRKNRALVSRYLDRALNLVVQQVGLRLVLLLDEFDELAQKMLPRGFAALRALRDDYKYRLMYIVATRLELNRLRPDTAEIEMFDELVSSHTFWLGLYNEADARLTLSRLADRHKFSLTPGKTEQLLTLTGRHSGLLREAYRVAREQPPDLEQALASEPQVQAECQRIWLSLAAEEQQALITLANGVMPLPSQAGVLARLERKGLVSRPAGPVPVLFSSVFAAYLKQQQPAAGARLYVDPQRHSLWLEGREVKGFTPLEYKLIAYLAQKPGQICTRDELAEHLYPGEMVPDSAGIADTRLDSIVKRVRKRIEPDTQEPRYLLTVRGHGFQLLIK